MTTEENKAIARRLVSEFVNAGNEALIDRYMAEGVVRHDLSGGRPEVHGRDGIKLLAAVLRRAFPDIHVTVDDIVAEGDRVAVRFTATGTHSGEFLGVPATGRSVSLAGINIYRYESGQMAETWQLMDALGLMRQLGAVPATGPAQG